MADKDGKNERKRNIFVQKAVKIGLIAIPIIMYVSWVYNIFRPCPRLSCEVAQKKTSLTTKLLCSRLCPKEVSSKERHPCADYMSEHGDYEGETGKKKKGRFRFGGNKKGEKKKCVSSFYEDDLEDEIEQQRREQWFRDEDEDSYSQDVCESKEQGHDRLRRNRNKKGEKKKCVSSFYADDFCDEIEHQRKEQSFHTIDEDSYSTRAHDTQYASKNEVDVCQPQANAHDNFKNDKNGGALGEYIEQHRKEHQLCKVDDKVQNKIEVCDRREHQLWRVDDKHQNKIDVCDRREPAALQKEKKEDHPKEEKKKSWKKAEKKTDKDERNEINISAALDRFGKQLYDDYTRELKKVIGEINEGVKIEEKARTTNNRDCCEKDGKSSSGSVKHEEKFEEQTQQQMVENKINTAAPKPDLKPIDENDPCKTKQPIDQTTSKLKVDDCCNENVKTIESDSSNKEAVNSAAQFNEKPSTGTNEDLTKIKIRKECDPDFYSSDIDTPYVVKDYKCESSKQPTVENEEAEDALKNFWHACGPPKGLKRGCQANGCKDDSGGKK